MARQGGVDRGLFRRDGCWWIYWVCAYGHRHKEKVGTAKGQARDYYQKRKLQVKLEGFCLTEAKAQREAAKPVLFQDVAKQYMEWAREHRPRSIMFRDKALKHLLAAFGPRPLTELTRSEIEAYLARRRDSGAAPGTVNRERAVLSHSFNRAILWGMVEKNPVTGTEQYVELSEDPRPLTPDEEARLLPMLPAHYLPFVTLAMHTGLRLGELRAQTWKGTDLEQGTLTVTRPKSGKREVLPLNQTARRLLTSLERTGPLVFPRIPSKLSDLFIRYVKKAGLEGVTFHCLRDTFISRLAPHVSAPSLMALARHRDYRTTRRYLRIDEAHLKAAVERLTDPETGDGMYTQRDTEKMAVAQLLESIGIDG